MSKLRVESGGSGQPTTLRRSGRSNVQTWLWSLIGLAAVAVIAVGTASYVAVSRMAQTGTMVLETAGIIDQLNEIIIRLDEAETSQRGFLISGDEAFLKHYHSAVGRIPSHMDQLRQAMASSPDLVGHLKELDGHIAAKITELSDTIATRQSSGFEAARAALADQQDQDMMQQIRLLVDHMELHEQDLVAARSVQRDQYRRVTELMIILGTVLASMSLIAIGIVRDVSGRRRAEDALRSSQERYRGIVENTPDTIFIHAEWRIVFANQSALALLRANSIDQIIGMNPLELSPPRHRDRIRERIHALYTERRPAPWIQVPVVRLDGSTVDVEVSATPLEHDGIPAGLVIMRDVSDRTRRELELYHNQAVLEQAQQVATMGSWDSDPTHDGSLKWSRENYRIFGLAEDEFDGRVETFFSLVHPDDREAVRQASLAAINHDVPYAIDHRIIRPDGSVRWVHERAVITRDADGRPVRMLGVTQDITDRKLAELRQSFMMQELDHRVKNNLAAVLSIAEQTMMCTASMEEFRSAFTGRIAALARTHSALAVTKWEGIDLARLLRLTLEPFARDAQDRVVLEGPDLLLPPRAAAPLCMAFHELATNAAKYGSLSNPAGAVHVRWSCSADRTVEIHWRETGGPDVVTPTRRGFGSDLIEGLISYELAGRSVLTFNRDGLCCDMMFPVLPAGAGFDEGRSQRERTSLVS